MQGQPSSTAIVAAIADAFPTHPLAPDHAFTEWGTTYLDAEKFENQSRGQRWNELTLTFLEFHQDAIWFLGPLAYAEYLPAFLTAVVVPTKEIDSLPPSLLNTLIRKQDDLPRQRRFDARLQHLNEKQQRTVACALEFLEQTLPDGLEKDLAKSALDDYWRNILRRR